MNETYGMGYSRITQSQIIVLTYPRFYKSARLAILSHLIQGYASLDVLSQLILGYANKRNLYLDIQGYLPLALRYNVKLL